MNSTLSLLLAAAFREKRREKEKKPLRSPHVIVDVDVCGRRVGIRRDTEAQYMCVCCLFFDVAVSERIASEWKGRERE